MKRLRELFTKKYDINNLYVAVISQVTDEQCYGFSPDAGQRIKYRFATWAVLEKLPKTGYGKDYYRQVTTGLEFETLGWKICNIGEYFVNGKTIKRLSYVMKNKDIEYVKKGTISEIEYRLNKKQEKKFERDRMDMNK